MSNRSVHPSDETGVSDTTKGVGAWRVPGGYRQGMAHADDERVRYVVAGLQNDLVRRNLLAKPTNPFPGEWGSKTTAAMKTFQTSYGLEADGVYGPKSARMWFNPFFVWWENVLKIPERLLYGQSYSESMLDPGAQGYDTPLDRGLCQFNLTAHPDMTDAICYGDAPLCIQRAADLFDTARTKAAQLSGKPLDSRLVLDCAIANHNNPALAQQWASSGSPPVVASRSFQIAEYVDAVRTAAATAPT